MAEKLTEFGKIARPLAQPHQFKSFLHLFRRVQVGADFGRRIVEDVRHKYHDPLIISEDGWLVLTPVGGELVTVANRLSALAERTEIPPDVLAVEADALLAETLLAQAFPTYLDLWQTVSQPRICPMQPDRTPKNIQNGATAFALSFAGSTEKISKAEAAGPPSAWVLVMQHGHRLMGPGPVAAESLTPGDRVFLTEMAMEWPMMDGFIKAVPACNRIVCGDSTLAIRLAMSGLGVAIVPDVLPDRVGGCKRVISEIDPIQPRFVLPRKGVDGLTEPEQCLVEEIRKVAEARCQQETPEAEKDTEEVVEALVEETITPMEGVLS